MNNWGEMNQGSTLGELNLTCLKDMEIEQANLLEP